MHSIIHITNYVDGKKIDRWLSNNTLHRVGYPAYIEYKNNSKIVEKYYFNNKLHNDNGPAVIFFKDNNVSEELYFHHGEESEGITHVQYFSNGEKKYVKYKIGNKSIIKKYFANGNIHEEEYYDNNLLHNLEGPAYIEYNDKGAQIKTIYYLFGKKHRSDGPACTYHTDDTLVQKWYTSGRLRNNGKPNEIIYYDDKKVKKWLTDDDVLHRVDLPAYIVVEDGVETYRAYYINGCRQHIGDEIVREQIDDYTYTSYYTNGCIHRSEGPAYIVKKGDHIKEERYYEYGNEVQLYSSESSMMTDEDDY